MDLFALATLPAAADEAGGPPSIKFYELRDNLLVMHQSRPIVRTATLRSNGSSSATHGGISWFSSLSGEARRTTRGRLRTASWTPLNSTLKSSRIGQQAPSPSNAHPTAS